MRQKGMWSVFAVLALLAAGCATPLAVVHDYDTTYDFTKLKTYNWLPSPPGDQMEEMTEKRVVAAVNNALQAKQYSQDAAAPDFLVAVEGIKKTVTTGASAVGLSVGVPVGKYGTVRVGSGKGRTHEKQEGTLTVNIIDAKANELIWQGSASATIKEKSSPEEQQQRANEAVAELFKKFPPGKAQ